MLNLPVTGIVHNFCTTPIYSAIINLGRGSDPIRSAGFKPTQLFTSNTNGAWYDPSDINLTWRRNLLTYTEQFDNAAWVASVVNITANALSAPDGTLTADMFTTTSVFNSFRLNSDVTVTPSTSYTLSFYAYRGSATDAKYSIYNTSAGADIVSATSFFSQTVSGAWSRVTLTFTVPTGCTSIRVFLLRDTGVLGSIYIWGAQLEQGSTATPYQRITDGIKDYLDYKPLPILYQDAAGTTPVTAVGQPVGLMLDKSKGLVLGSEVTTNGSFATDTAWTKGAGWSISGDAARTDGTQGATSYIQQGINGPAGIYLVSVVVTANSGSLRFDIGSNTSGNITGTGVKTAILTKASSATTQLYIGAAAGVTCVIDSISVRELPGNHAYNPSGNSANFPVLSARYNLLTKTEQFDDAAWLKASSGSGVLPTISADAGLSPVGTQTADLITINRSTTTGLSFLTQRLSDDGVQKSRILHVKAFSASDVGKVLDTWTFDTAVANRFAITLTTDWQKVTLPNVTLSAGGVREQLAFGYLDKGSLSPNTGEIKFYIWGADLRVANDALNQPAYQRVNTATDYDTVGFKPYLSFNGVNQWLQTNSIDFTYGDKMFVSAGVRKLSDAASSVLLETSSDFGSNNGSIAIRAPRIPGASQYNAGIRISAAASVDASTYTAPISSIVSVNFKSSSISISDAISVRVDSGTPTSLVPLGSTPEIGNFGNYPLYIGARAGSSLFFNGRLYGLVIAGKQATSDEITNTERYLNLKTGAY